MNEETSLKGCRRNEEESDAVKTDFQIKEWRPLVEEFRTACIEYVA